MHHPFDDDQSEKVFDIPPPIRYSLIFGLFILNRKTDFERKHPKNTHMPSPPSGEGAKAVAMPEKPAHIRIAKKKASSPASIERFFVPDWTDGHLPSKNFIELVKAMRFLVEEAEHQLQTTTALSRSLKTVIYREFTRYATSRDLPTEEFVHCDAFWKHMQDINSPAREVLDKFKNVYCFRLVTVYLHKIKFIATLAESIDLPLTETHFFSPNSFIGDIFKKGSSTELNCRSLKASSYSWFRPSHRCKHFIKELGTSLPCVSVTEMAKSCNYDVFTNRGGDSAAPTSTGDHSLSHKTFGLFLNDLLTNYPLWLRQNRKGPQKINHEVLNTRFVGDALTSLAMSHWLAREENLDRRTNEILCPDFSGNETNGGPHINICHELQFLTLLAKTAHVQQFGAVEYICSTIRSKYAKKKTQSPGQMALPLGGDDGGELLYKRVVLNLSDLPKKNPHHFLITQINHHKNVLDEDGVMVVLCNQKLFVPSQADRVRSLLQGISIRTSFQLNELRGKGEVPDFLYIFKKKDKNSHMVSSSAFSNAKKSLLTFNISGELSLFKNFSKVVDALKHFLMTKIPYSTPIHRQEIDNELIFEFHQDALINGKLLGASGHSENNVPHPNFFKNLIRSCTTFDQFFLVEHLNHQKRFELTNDLLGLHYSYEDKYPFVLIVDYSHPTQVSLEIIHSQAYKARIEKYGTAYFQYYGLLAKIPDININLIREFFGTEIGSQVIQLSLDGHTSNLKSKINSLLIPRFFAQTDMPPKHVQKSLSLLKAPSEELLKIHPQALEKMSQDADRIATSLANEYPWYIMGLYIHFKNNCSLSIEQVGGKSAAANYRNPLIIDKLSALETHPILDNKDIHIKFNFQDKGDVHLPLYAAFTRREGDNTILELQSRERVSPVCSFYADEVLIHFLDHLLQEAKGTSISSLLQGLHIPRTESLKEALNACHSLKDALENIRRNCEKAVSDIFVRQISLPPPPTVPTVEQPRTWHRLESLL